MNRPDQPPRPTPRRTPTGAPRRRLPPGAPQRRALPDRRVDPDRPTLHRATAHDGTQHRPVRPRPARRPPPGRTRRPAQRRPLRLASPGTRLRIGLFAVAFLLSLFAGRLLQLQGVDASAYATVADNERRVDQTVSATRGTITDRSGVPLATTIDSVNVFADQTRVENPALTARMLAPFVDVDVATLERGLVGDRQFEYLAKDVDVERWIGIADLELDGIHAERTHRRTYPGSELGANILGFVDASGVGQAGVEQVFNPTLTGRDGSFSDLRDGNGRRIPSGATKSEQAVPGQDLRLTIDRDLQWVAQQSLAAAVEKSGAMSGVAVAMTPDGKVLALATVPTFDPADFSTPIEARGNAAVEEIYEPGSVLKPLTVAALIEEGLATPASTYTVADRIVIDGEDYGDHSPHATERMTLAGILADSSNVGTIMAADPLPRETHDAYLRSFGIGEPSGLGLPGEGIGLLPDDRYEATRHTAAFGQGVSMNAVTLTSIYATIANDGVRVAPTVVVGTVGPDGEITPAPAPAERRVISPATAGQVSEMLEMVVTDGTGKTGAIPGYRVAGKTGTAQRFNAACGGYCGYTASFSGFAPADDPAIVVSVSLQDPVNGRYGGVLAGPVFNEIVSYGLQALEVPPTGAAPPALPLRESDDPVNVD